MRIRNIYIPVTQEFLFAKSNEFIVVAIRNVFKHFQRTLWLQFFTISKSGFAPVTMANEKNIEISLAKSKGTFKKYSLIYLRSLLEILNKLAMKKYLIR